MGEKKNCLDRLIKEPKPHPSDTKAAGSVSQSIICEICLKGEKSSWLERAVSWFLITLW